MSLRSEIIKVLNEVLAGSKKISELPAAGSIVGPELVEIVQDGVNKQTTASALSSGGGSSTEKIVEEVNTPTYEFIQADSGKVKEFTVDCTANFPDGLSTTFFVDCYAREGVATVSFTSGGPPTIESDVTTLTEKQAASFFFSNEDPNILIGVFGVGGGSGSSTFVGLTDGPGPFTGKTLNFVRVNAGETALEYQTPTQVRTDIGAGTGNGDALTSGTLAQFASTTSAQLRGVLSDETGTGAAVFADSPTLSGTPVSTTATTGTNTTQIATTAFVQQENALKANLDSPTFTGTPAAPTATGGTNTTQVATTAFVQQEIGAVNGITKIYAQQNFK